MHLCWSAFGQLRIQQNDATKIRDIQPEAYLALTCVYPWPRQWRPFGEGSRTVFPRFIGRGCCCQRVLVSASGHPARLHQHVMTSSGVLCSTASSTRPPDAEIIETNLRRTSGPSGVPRRPADGNVEGIHCSVRAFRSHRRMHKIHRGGVTSFSADSSPTRPRPAGVRIDGTGWRGTSLQVCSGLTASLKG